MARTDGTLLTSYLDNIEIRCRDLLPCFAGKKVFIAGGTGFYGQWFTLFFQHLQAKGLNVEIESQGRRTGWSINDASTHTPFQSQADYIFHCAFPVSNGVLSDDESERIIVDGTKTLLNGAKSGAQVIFISSGAVHNAESKLGELKRRAENLIAGRGQIVRPFATVGPLMNLSAHFAISRFILNRLEKRPLEVISYPIYRSFAHIVDVLVQTLHVAAWGDGKPYDVGSDSVLTVEQAARLISSDIRYTDSSMPSYAGTLHVANLHRIRSQFNLDLHYDSSAAILDTLRYYENHSADTLSS